MTNADRCFEHFVYGNWKYKSTDKLRLNSDTNEFFYKGTLIGLIDMLYLEKTDVYYTYICLPIKTFKSDSGYATQVKALYKSAIKYGYNVVFVDELDLGFGTSPIWDLYPSQIYKNIAKIQKLTGLQQVIALSFFDDEASEYHIRYFDNFDFMAVFDQCWGWGDKCAVCVYPPNYCELSIILHSEITEVAFALPSKEKDEFVWSLQDEINAGTKLNSNGKKVKLYYIQDKNIKETSK